MLSEKYAALNAQVAKQAAGYDRLFPDDTKIPPKILKELRMLWASAESNISVWMKVERELVALAAQAKRDAPDGDLAEAITYLHKTVAKLTQQFRQVAYETEKTYTLR